MSTSERTPDRAQRRPPVRERVGATELVDVSFTVNGSEVSVSVPTRMHLADALRDHLGLTGTHLGCEHGVCGMCTVLVDGDAARACLLFAVQCEGAEIVTVEGLGSPDAQHPLQQAFSAHHGLQCGFCTPGMLTTLTEFLRDNPDPTEQEVRVAISGNLCRCTGYQNIVAAALDAAKRLQGKPATA
jgi:carbon-monoxide dehydrogenase small subunit